MFPDLYVTRYLCSPVSMFPGSMLPDPYVSRSYVPRSLCSPIPMFPSTYVPRYLSSPSFFFGGGGEMEVWGVLEQFVDKIGRVVSFFKMVATATLEDLFCSLSDRTRCVFNITFPMTSRMRTLFYPPPDEVGAGVGLRLSGGPDVRPSVCLYAFPFRSRSVDGFLQFCTHTSHRGCRCAFWGLWNFNYLNGRPSAIISLNMPDIWPHFVLFLEHISGTHGRIHFILHTHIS